MILTDVEYENVRNEYSTVSLYDIKGSSKLTVFVYLKCKTTWHVPFLSWIWTILNQPAVKDTFIWHAGEMIKRLRWCSYQVFPRQHHQIWRFDHDYYRGVGSGTKNEEPWLGASVSSFLWFLTRFLSFPGRGAVIGYVCSWWFERQ